MRYDLEYKPLQEFPNNPIAASGHFYWKILLPAFRNAIQRITDPLDYALMSALNDPLIDFENNIYLSKLLGKSMLEVQLVKKRYYEYLQKTIAKNTGIFIDTTTLDRLIQLINNNHLSFASINQGTSESQYIHYSFSYKYLKESILNLWSNNKYSVNYITLSNESKDNTCTKNKEKRREKNSFINRFPQALPGLSSHIATSSTGEIFISLQSDQIQSLSITIKFLCSNYSPEINIYSFDIDFNINEQEKQVYTRFAAINEKKQLLLGLTSKTMTTCSPDSFIAIQVRATHKDSH